MPRFPGPTVVLFTRDLRVHDNPALRAACDASERVVPLFVLDDAVLRRFGAPNRVAFLVESLRDLDGELRARGGELVVRRGDVVAEVVRAAREVEATSVFLADDVSAYAGARERRLIEAGLEVRTFSGVTVVPPGDLAPTGGGDHFVVFSAYWNRWRVETRRAVLEPPASIRLPARLDPERIPDAHELVRGQALAALPRGGEREGRRRLGAWLRRGLAEYAERRDDLAAGATSHLSPYLHFGCVSPLELVERASARPGADPFVRQLCWRDFNHQLLAARPELAREDMRSRGDRWRDDEAALDAWKEGRTGYPLVDAGMRQLLAEGFMHNRARLVAASFLTKHLYLDWRLGADHFASLLVDGDVANNALNWQWVAGTGADTRPNRVLNPALQARRYDPRGDYVRRYVEELADPIVDHDDAMRRFREARGRGELRPRRSGSRGRAGSR